MLPPIDPHSKSELPVRVEDIERSHGIGGKLGRPLGQVVSVAGTVIDGNTGTTASKFESYHYYLKVDVLNERKLDKPVIIMLREEDKPRVVAGSREADRLGNYRLSRDRQRPGSFA